MTNASNIHYDSNGDARSFSGAAAVDVFRAATLASAIKLLAVGIKPCRGMTMTKALAMAGEYTGKKYKRGEHEQARSDLSAHVQRAKASIPSTHG